VVIKEFDLLGISSTFNNMQQLNSTTKYFAASLEQRYCSYIFNLFLQCQSIILSLSVVGVFMFVSLVCLGCCGGMTTKTCLDTVKTTNTIVSSLFPGAVEDKLLEVTRNQYEKQN
jgi:hypothetical protein